MGKNVLPIPSHMEKKVLPFMGAYQSTTHWLIEIRPEKAGSDAYSHVESRFSELVTKG